MSKTDADSLNELEEQRKYNSKKSKRYKKLYYSFGIASIVLSASTTVIPTIKNIPPVIPVAVAAISAIFLGISQFVGFQKHWVNCRGMAELLKIEKRNFLYGLEEYNEKERGEREKILVERLNQILSKENDIWKKLILENEEDEK